MKRLLTIALILVATAASAQFIENSMGMFFSETDFITDFTNWDTDPATPFDGYVVLVNPTMAAIGAYEVGIEISDPAVFILGVTGPGGWTNFGDNLNHLCGYTTPLPSMTDGVVLSTMTMLYSGSQTVEIDFGPSAPSSVDDLGPAVADGISPEILYVCNYTSGPNGGGLAATLNGDGVYGGGCPAVESCSYSAVKGLFR